MMDWFKNIYLAYQVSEPLHGPRVAMIARCLAERLGLNPETQNLIHIACFYHDIGKAKVNPAILRKSGKLTPEERQQIEQHPLYGAELIKDLPNSDEWVHIVRLHHEKLDGSGYPYGLKGEAIPLEVRIVTVADIYDALTSSRPYREPMGHEDAMEIVWSMVPHQLDAAVVKALEMIADTDDLVEVDVAGLT